MKIDDLWKLRDFEPTNTAEDHHRFQEYLRKKGIDVENFYQELEMSARFVNTHRDISYSGAHMGLHSHSYYEILCCTSEAEVEYLMGSERYRLQKGDIIIIPPGVSHRPLLPERLAVPYTRDVIWASMEFMELLQRMIPNSPSFQSIVLSPVRTAGTRWEFMAELFHTGVREEEEKRSGWEAIVMGNTMTILANLWRAHREQSAGIMHAEKPELTDRITAYIEENYARRITVSDLARQFYVSESAISHCFREKMGVSLYRYITQRRLIAAKSRIQEGMVLEDVSHAVGFTDYSAFYRAFRQEFGISPRQYRRLQEPAPEILSK